VVAIAATALRLKVLTCTLPKGRGGSKVLGYNFSTKIAIEASTIKACIEANSISWQ